MYNLSAPCSGKALVICEKPSVASDLLSAFGGGSRGDGFFDFSLGKITWCFGHLVELLPPAAYNPEWEKWDMSFLPMVPEEFSFKYGIVSGKDGGKGAAKQLKVIAELLKDCDYLVNATDAGREGELIFWEVAKFAGWGKDQPAAVPGRKPCYRFWSNKMTADGLRSSWNSMKPIKDYLPLARAAYCRSEADWLLGINMTRACTKAFPRKWGEGESDKVKVWSVGRVQTPVLALIVRRDLSIENFVSQPFYEVRLDYRDAANDGAEIFTATLQVPDGIPVFEKESEGEAQGQKSRTGFASKESAQRVLDEILSRKSEPWAVEDQVSEGVENPPGLFSLTDLQRWCNQAWGWSAQKTLVAAQAAYEEEKVLTYPRTTSSFLPEDSKSEMDRVHSELLSNWAKSAAPALVSLGLPLPASSPRAGFLFDDSKVSDHYAIVPTGIIPKNLDSDVGRLWLAVVRRFYTAFAAPAKVRSVKRWLSLSGFPEGKRKAFASGKTYVDRGWMEADDLLSGLTGGIRKSSARILATCGPLAAVQSGLLHEGATTPPRAFDEASLLATMENISAKLSGEELEDGEVSLNELKEALSDLGLGTPATRAEIIETLLVRGFISRSSKPPVPRASGKQKAGKGKGSAKYICSTPSGRYLIASLEKLDLKYLTEALMTAQWEKRLSDMAEGRSEEGREDFLSDLVKMLEEAVAIFAANVSSGPPKPQAVSLDVLCPKSGEPVKDYGNYYVFPGAPTLRLWKTVAQKELSAEDYFGLVTDGKTDLLEGFVSKKGQKFSAHLVLLEDGKLSFEFPEREAAAPIVVEGVICPKSGKPVLDFGKFYRFPGKPKIAFWKVVAQRNMTASEYAEVIEKGRTGPLEGFVSSKGSKFSAALVLKGDKISFDFPDSKGAKSKGKKK